MIWLMITAGAFGGCAGGGTGGAFGGCAGCSTGGAAGGRSGCGTGGAAGTGMADVLIFSSG